MPKEQLNDLVSSMYEPFFDMISDFFNSVFTVVFVLVLVFVVLFFLTCRINFMKLSPEYLERLHVKFLPYNLFRWWLYDVLTIKNRKNIFNPFGFTLFCGRQGSGKTISMVKYGRDLKEKYPKCIVVANFACSFADYRMTSWRDFLEIRNGLDGVLFMIDEIHSEFSSAAWKDFPESILSEISQQRKQRIKIVATSQVYSRVAKPIREQAFSVVLCSTFYGRLTNNREFDAAEFSTSGDSAYKIKRGVKPIWRSLFVQSNALRGCYDTYEKIERMQGVDFIPRNERGFE